jgi:hypothetical protein
MGLDCFIAFCSVHATDLQRKRIIKDKKPAVWITCSGLERGLDLWQAAEKAEIVMDFPGTGAV